MKLIYVLLNLIILKSVSAASWATVTSDKAVVYADAQMTSKVGYLKKDKKIRIGEKSVNNNKLYPLVYQKRVLYIKKIDIQTSDELLALSSAMDRALKKSTSIEPYQKVSFGVGVSAVGISSDKSYKDNTKSMNMINTTLAGYYVRPSKKDAFKVSFDYSSGEVDEESISLLNLDFYYLKRLIGYKRFKLFASAGLLLCPLFTYSYAEDFTQNGSGFGASIGLESSYMLTKNLEINLNFDYRYQRLKVDLPSGIEPSRYEPTIISPRLAIGLSYSY